MADVDLKFEGDSRFLDHLDFIRDGKWMQFTFTVKGIHPRGHFENQKEKKPIDQFSMTFEETDKSLLLKVTNSRLANLVLGDCRASVVRGKKLALHAVKGKWTKGNFGIRVRCDNWAEHGIARHHMGEDLTGQPIYPEQSSGAK